MSVNVILTCAGRRNYLVDYFKTALAGRGKVLTADASADAVALKESDGCFLLPLVSDADYFDRLLDICRDNQVKLIIPLNDLELPLLARQKHRFLEVGTFPVVSDAKFIDTCFDKFLSSNFLVKCGVLTPLVYVSLSDVYAALERSDIRFPLVVKPRWGSASIGIVYVHDLEELDLGYRYVKKLLSRSFLSSVSSSDSDRCILIQEKIIGQEYGLDIVNNLDGCYQLTSVKKKLAMRSGETDRAITIDDKSITNIARTIAINSKHIGNLDCDLIVSDKGAYIIEMNPRFGGGYPFSHVAGLNLPSALLAWANGDEPDPEWLGVKPNVKSSKCDRLVLF